jgi:hypothetical protein
MSNEKQKITCPNCGHPIDVNELLYHQLSEQVQKEYGTKLSNLEKKEQLLNEAIEKGVKKQLQTEKSQLEKKLRLEIAGESAEAIRTLEEKLDVKSKEVQSLNQIKIELSQVKREKDELKGQIEAEAQERFNNLLKVEKGKILNQVQQDNELKFSEKDHVIETLNGQLKEMQRKIEQGSMQIQGEVQELAIEEFLKAHFPYDIINEVKKGARGADCLQTINTLTRQNCGSIYIESKRTKEFQASWIDKFKDDMRLKNATVGAIVTDVYPKDMERLGQKDGVWICSYQEFKGLCFVLREMVVLYSNAMASQENRDSKMELLYSYLCSTEFQRQVEAIVEGFTQMNSDMLSEQRSMAMIWKKRQKQIDKVLQNTIHMYANIKGIAGSSIQTIPALELPSSDNQVA